MLADLEFKLCNLENAARIGEIITSYIYIYTANTWRLAATRICDRCDIIL